VGAAYYAEEGNGVAPALVGSASFIGAFAVLLWVDGALDDHCAVHAGRISVGQHTWEEAEEGFAKVLRSPLLQVIWHRDIM